MSITLKFNGYKLFRFQKGVPENNVSGTKKSLGKFDFIMWKYT